MSLSSLVAVDLNQGATFQRTVLLQNSNSAVPPVISNVDLTGSSAQMMIRSAYNQPSPLITLTSGLGGGIVLGSVAGTVAITITPAQTFLLPVLVPAGFSPKNGPPTQIYVSDLDITNASGTVIRYVNFVITVYATVTK